MYSFGPSVQSSLHSDHIIPIIKTGTVLFTVCYNNKNDQKDTFRVKKGKYDDFTFALRKNENGMPNIVFISNYIFIVLRSND